MGIITEIITDIISFSDKKFSIGFITNFARNQTNYKYVRANGLKSLFFTDGKFMEELKKVVSRFRHIMRKDIITQLRRFRAKRANLMEQS